MWDVVVKRQDFILLFVYSNSNKGLVNMLDKCLDNWNILIPHKLPSPHPEWGGGVNWPEQFHGQYILQYVS